MKTVCFEAENIERIVEKIVDAIRWIKGLALLSLPVLPLSLVSIDNIAVDGGGSASSAGKMRTTTARFKHVNAAVPGGYVPIPGRCGPGPLYVLQVSAWKADPRGKFADPDPVRTCVHAL